VHIETEVTYQNKNDLIKVVNEPNLLQHRDVKTVYSKFQL